MYDTISFEEFLVQKCTEDRCQHGNNILKMVTQINKIDYS